jgi:hypothetical protein
MNSLSIFSGLLILVRSCSKNNDNSVSGFFKRKMQNLLWKIEI